MRRTGLASLRVPTTRQVIPGARVSIVLKADQPTGRTVSGVVRDVLTRGDHPRGIKVRLDDGRVGRVQSILPANADPTDGVVMGSDDGEGSKVAGNAPWPGRRRRRGGDEAEDEQPMPTQEVSLDAYIKPAKPNAKGKNRGVGSSSTAKSPATGASGGGENGQHSGDGSGTARCPVCEDFEGDEAAVAHHVASHFDT